MINRFFKDLFEADQVVRIAGLFLAATLVWQTVKVVQKNYNLQLQVDRLKDEIAILQLQNERYEYDIEYLKTKEYQELAARAKFNKKAAGEHVVALSKKEPIDPLPVEDQARLEPKPQYQENLEQWLYFLLKKEPS
ncbi:MAG TPA: hypothetical protein VGA08_02400 [Candidatus Saccharimonadales bacterium]